MMSYVTWRGIVAQTTTKHAPHPPLHFPAIIAVVCCITARCAGVMVRVSSRVTVVKTTPRSALVIKLHNLPLAQDTVGSNHPIPIAGVTVLVPDTETVAEIMLLNVLVRKVVANHLVADACERALLYFV